MFILAQLLLALSRLVDITFTLYMWIVIVRALVSWMSPDPSNPLVRFLVGVTEPVLRPVRRHLPLVGGFDFSPVIVIIVLVVAEGFLVNTLRDLAFQLR